MQKQDEERKWPRMGLRIPPALRENVRIAAEFEGMRIGQYCRHVLKVNSDEVIANNSKPNNENGVDGK